MASKKKSSKKVSAGWTDKDKAFLKKALSAGKLTYAEIAAKLGKSEAAVRTFASRDM